MAETSRYRFIIWTPIIASQLVMGMTYMCISPLFPMIMGEFQIDRATVSLLISAIALIFAICTIPAGLIAAKFGLKLTFGIGALLMGAGAFTRFISSFTPLLTLRVIYGIGGALRFPAMSGLVMQWFRSRELTIVNAVNMIGSSLGISIGMFLVPRMAANMNWKMVLTTFGIVLIIIAVAWFFLGKERVIQKPEASDEGKTITTVSLATAMRQRATWMLALAAMGPMSLWVALNSWLPTYYTEVFNMPLSTSSSVVGLFNLLGIPACIIGGILPIKVGLRKPFFIIPGTIIGLAGLGTFLFNNLTVIYLSVAILGLCVWVFWPSLMTIPMELPGMTPQLVAIVMAVVMGIANCAAFVAPLLVGYLADTTGSYVLGFSIWALASYSLLASGLLLAETGPRSKHRRNTATLGR